MFLRVAAVMLGPYSKFNAFNAFAPHISFNDFMTWSLSPAVPIVIVVTLVAMQFKWAFTHWNLAFVQIAIFLSFGTEFLNPNHNWLVNVAIYLSLNFGFYFWTMPYFLRKFPSSRYVPVAAPRVLTAAKVLDLMTPEERCAILREYQGKAQFIEDLSLRVLTDNTMSAHEIADILSKTK